jgi:hypothetical protein
MEKRVVRVLSSHSDYGDYDPSVCPRYAAPASQSECRPGATASHPALLR